MLPTALNHVTAPGLSFVDLLSLAKSTGCSGIELRTDLPTPMFDGLTAEVAGRRAEDANVEILTIAEVKAFNDWSDEKAEEADRLMQIAAACGSKGVTLIPRNDGLGLGNGERQANLRIALRELMPMLEAHDLMGFVEPLGFEHCSLQYKSEAVEIIEALRAENRIKLVHDTFHHFLAGGGPVFPDHTAIVHVSGVTDAGLAAREMEDHHRVLVDGQDRIGNVAQIEHLIAGNFSGAVSIEAFAPEVQKITDPRSEIRRSFGFISSRLAEMAA